MNRLECLGFLSFLDRDHFIHILSDHTPAVQCFCQARRHKCCLIVIFSKERVVRVILLNTQFSVLLTVYFTYTRLFRYSPSQHLRVFSINRLCDVGEFRKVGNTSL